LTPVRTVETCSADSRATSLAPVSPTVLSATATLLTRHRTRSRVTRDLLLTARRTILVTFSTALLVSAGVMSLLTTTMAMVAMTVAMTVAMSCLLPFTRSPSMVVPSMAALSTVVPSTVAPSTVAPSMAAPSMAVLST
ncbi:hypothetical protein GGI09_008390, partial [Coemansia sp. S100]